MIWRGARAKGEKGSQMQPYHSLKTNWPILADDNIYRNSTTILYNMQGFSLVYFELSI